MKALLLASALLAAPAFAQSHPEDNDRRPVRAIFNELTPVKPDPAFVTKLRAPQGYRVAVWAEGLGNARMLAVAPNGDVYLSRRAEGDIVRLRDADGDGRADAAPVVVVNRPGLHGLAVQGGTLYFMTAREVFSAPILADGGIGAIKTVVDDLPDAGQHPNRTLAAGPDGMLYVSVGSTCNACDETSQESATMLRLSPDGTRRMIWASGLRNTIGFGWHPRTGALWGWDQGIDWLGDDEQREEYNEIVAGQRYGWPYIYEDGKKNPQDEPPAGLLAADWRAASRNPALMYTAHSAGMQMAFHPGGGFGPDAGGDAFVALHGSWNRSTPSGYEVVRIRFDGAGRATKIEPFLTGFAAGNRQFGRPCGLAVLADGSMLVTDDANGVIYRISYDGAQGRAAAYAPPATAMLSQAQAARGASMPLALARPELRPSGAASVRLTSSDFAAGGTIPRDRSEYGLGVSPALAWDAVPSAVSYALIVEDPDAATAPAVHWTAWNVPATATQLPAGLQERDRLDNAELKGMRQGSTARGSIGWYGPKPPRGDRPHHYRFQLLALDRMLDLPLGATRDQLLAAAADHVLATGELTGTYAEPVGGK